VRAGREATGRHHILAGPLPIVRLADRLRAMPLFAHVSVDELFRVAGTARQIAHDRGRNLAPQGAPAKEVFLLVEGTVRLTSEDEPAGTVAAPAALALEEALDHRRLRRTITAVEPVICLALAVEDLLTMLSDNIAMAQGLFRTLLAGQGTSAAEALTMTRGAHSAPAPATPMNVVDKARLLRQNPLLGQASVEQLLALSAITREVALAVGAVLPADRDGPAVYHLLAGEVRLEFDGDTPVVMGPGRTVFVAETLAGATPRHRATVTREGHALRLDHDELFDVLADHTDLLQGVFSGVLGAGRRLT
jgi:CRP-like cAMP-binding protein